jgi:hypothetical protein
MRKMRRKENRDSRSSSLAWLRGEKKHKELNTIFSFPPTIRKRLAKQEDEDN